MDNGNFQNHLNDGLNGNPKQGGRKKAVVAVVCILVTVLLAFVAAGLVKYFVVTTFTVDGVSMYPTLDGGNGAENDNNPNNGETLYLNKVANIKRNDIIVFKRPQGWETSATALVKRVVALAGDRIAIAGNRVFLNGSPLDEPYIYDEMYTPDLPETLIPEGYVFCLGDNRNNSADSRFYGAFSEEYVVGKCFLVKGLNGKLRRL